MLKYILSLLLFGSTLAAYGQDTIYFDKSGNHVTASAHYDHSEIRMRDPADSNRVTVQSFSPKGVLQSVTHYSDYSKTIEGGAYERFYEDGRRYTVANYQNGLLEGELKTYWENGEIKRDDFFSKGKWLHGKCFDSTGKTVPHTVYEVMPEFPGGEKALLHYLSKSVHYPKQARKKGIEGEVVVQFVVEQDGRVDRIAVTRHVAPEIDAEAVRAVSDMPRWKPGRQDDRIIVVQYSLPIRFAMTGKGK